MAWDTSAPSPPRAPDPPVRVRRAASPGSVRPGVCQAEDRGRADPRQPPGGGRHRRAGGAGGLVGLACCRVRLVSVARRPPRAAGSSRRDAAVAPRLIRRPPRTRACASGRLPTSGACSPPLPRRRAEPFATIRGLHRAHLRTLTGRLPAEPAARPRHRPPRRWPPRSAPRPWPGVTDCIAASAALAPLLASLSASADVAVSLLSPRPLRRHQ